MSGQILRGSDAAAAIIAPGGRARHLRASFDVPGTLLARGRVGGGANLADVHAIPAGPRWGGDFWRYRAGMGKSGSPMAAGVYVAGGVVGRTLPGAFLRNLGAQLPKLSEISRF